MFYLSSGRDLLAMAEVRADWDIALESADCSFRLERDVFEISHVFKLLELEPETQHNSDT